MIESIQFKNFKVLRNTTLPLGRFTLLVGPNGSGKSTAIEALQIAQAPARLSWEQIASVGLSYDQEARLAVVWDGSQAGSKLVAIWKAGRGVAADYEAADGTRLPATEGARLSTWLSRLRVYNLDAMDVVRPIQLRPAMEIGERGTGLAGVLDRIRDLSPERFEVLNEEFGRWLPEFDRVLFDTPAEGQRSLLLRTRQGGHRIPAHALSQGTLLALAVLTLAYSIDPPSIACLEEPEHGIHPRLFRHVQDALYRLSHPEGFGEQREPVQVLVTTHSPYFLDLFRDHPEEVVIANKIGLEARFERLADQPNIAEILEGGSLGDVWYTGILGGVPAEA